MNVVPQFFKWLRGWHRGYKFAVLLIAAWAPFLFAASPVVAVLVMAVATTLFFVVTGPKNVRDSQGPLPGETPDADA